MVYQAVYLMLTILLTAEAKLHEEPECSKFHFEEKVLEKLVRLEHQIELFQTRMKHWDVKMEGQILMITEAEVARKEKLDKHMSEITIAEVARTDKLNTLQDLFQQELEVQKVKLDEVLANFQRQVARLSQDLMDKQGDINKTLLASIKNQDTAVNQIKAELTTPTILFTAKTVANISPTVGSLLRYTETVTNIGGGYDTSTGFFTAPQDGTYIFTVQICNVHKKYFMVQIVAADNIIASVGTYDADSHSCTSVAGVVVLSKGDKVWIKCTYAGVVYNGSKRWNSFSGVLIHTNTK